MSEVSFHLFHGTDAKCAKSIQASGFVPKKNVEHWLGNGIYFFEDKSLAHWWTTRPTKKFSSNIEKPTIVEVTVRVNKENLLDMRCLCDYIECSQKFKEYLKIIIWDIKPGYWTKMKKLRCAFFDWLHNTHSIDCIVGTFNLKKQAYLPNSINKNMKHLLLPYIETQICVFSNALIHEIKYSIL